MRERRRVSDSFMVVKIMRVVGFKLCVVSFEPDFFSPQRRGDAVK